MFPPRLILLVLFLLLATLVNSAPLPDGYPSHSNQVPPSPPPEVRPALPLPPNINLYTAAQQRLTEDWNRVWDQAAAAGYYDWNDLLPTQRAHVQELLDEAAEIRRELTASC
ncbi:hypothetical protein CF328_g9344 [Tilletia controversa]|nr:hypothetical protein CF328_g9344 [Tilletia controversa]